MPTITSTGVGSGLDVNSIVSGLMTLEKRPLELMKAQASSIQTKLSAFSTLQSSLASLGDVAARVSDPAAWQPMRVDVGDATVVSASAGAKSVPGSHTLEVEQLAQSQVLASGWYSSTSAAVGSGTLTIELGTTAGGVFTPRSGGSPVSVTIDPSRQTLADVRDAINAAKAGVTASIVTGAQGAKLVLRGADGADSSVRVLATSDADGSATDASGLSALAWDPAAAAGAGRNLTQTQAAQDAKFSIDGVALTSATNTPSDALEGVSLTLRKATTGPVQLNVAVDTVAVRKNVNDFISAYNALNALVRNQTQTDGKTRGPLQADSSAVSLLNQLRSMLQGSLPGASGTNSLSQAGISLQRDGSLQVTESKLAPLLSDPAQLARLFSQPQSGADANTKGLGLRFKEWARALTGEGGALASRIDGLKRSATDNEKRQDRESDRVALTESRLRAQYQRLDTQMSDLNARMAQMKSSLGLA